MRSLYGTRLAGLVLYGSQAWGEAGDDSDIDVLVLLEGPVDRMAELRAFLSRQAGYRAARGDRLTQSVRC